jgi:hypothetical protein
VGFMLPELLDFFQTSQAKLGILGSTKLFIGDIFSGKYLAVLIEPLQLLQLFQE